MFNPRADPGFSFRGGGGGAKDYVRLTHITSVNPLRPRSRACLRVLEALWVFDALSCYLSLILCILKQNGIQKTYIQKGFIFIVKPRKNFQIFLSIYSNENIRGVVNQILGGRPPLNPAL